MKNTSYNISWWAVIALPLVAFATPPLARSPDSPTPAPNTTASATSTPATPTPTTPAKGTPAPAAPVPLDINDISFLWPVPQTKADVDALISLNDQTADGEIFSEELLAKLMDEAKTVGVGSAKI